MLQGGGRRPYTAQRRRDRTEAAGERVFRKAAASSDLDLSLGQQARRLTLHQPHKM